MRGRKMREFIFHFYSYSMRIKLIVLKTWKFQNLKEIAEETIIEGTGVARDQLTTTEIATAQEE